MSFVSHSKNSKTYIPAGEIEVADEMFNAELRQALSEQAAQMEIQITDSLALLVPGYASSLIISC